MTITLTIDGKEVFRVVTRNTVGWATAGTYATTIGTASASVRVKSKTYYINRGTNYRLSLATVAPTADKAYPDKYREAIWKRLNDSILAASSVALVVTE